MTPSRIMARIALPALVVAFTACQDLSQPLAPEGSPAHNVNANPQAHRAQEVAAWFRGTSPDVLAVPRTVFAAHDEVTNTIVVGVENENAARGVANALQRRGVPATAWRIVTAEPIYAMNTSLRSEHRPTVGGLQIHFGNYVCTLGFNVGHAGGRSFITNSHCTNNQGSTGTTSYFQPTGGAGSSPIATEAHDPAYTSLSGCSGGKVCRYSDAARALYHSGATSAQGVIAKTTGVNNGSLATNGSFTITAQDNNTTSFATGTTIHKVGRTTGWTSGTVTSTCASVNVSGSNIQLLCQTLVQRSGTQIVQGGDSGSPVFTRGSSDDVTLVGILWGGSSSGDLFVFSPLQGIQRELGSVSATAGGSPPGGEEPPPGGEEPPPPCTPKGKNGKNCK